MNNEQQPSSRFLKTASSPVPELGPLSQLPGTWKNSGQFKGHGWNMIALPFPSGNLDYRLLNNQYDETLDFHLVDENVPNRGIDGDQSVLTLDYVQSINQLIAEDFPLSGLAGDPNLAIHHEPGLWLRMKNETTDGLNIARLSSIPHGDAVMALGKSSESKTGFDIPKANGLPIGVKQDIDNNPYLKPYLHFHQQPFRGVFDPTDANELLNRAILPFFNDKKIANVTQLKVDSTTANGGINNIPFITKQANATEMSASFWIYELTEKHPNGETKFLLQYTQTIMLEFFKRNDGQPGLIKWPHISINTLEKQPNN